MCDALFSMYQGEVCGIPPTVWENSKAFWLHRGKRSPLLPAASASRELEMVCYDNKVQKTSRSVEQQRQTWTVEKQGGKWYLLPRHPFPSCMTILHLLSL